MPIDKKDFLIFSENLTDQTEISYRNSVSRAYYACYHHCLDVYKTKNITDGGVHKSLLDSIRQSQDKRDVVIYVIMKQLKSLRVMADYRLDNTISKNDRDTSIRQAKVLINKVGELTE